MNEEQPTQATEESASAAGEQTSQAQWSESDVERLRKMIGGKRDFIDGAVPAIVFVVANAVWSLTVAAVLAAGYGVGTALYRMARKHDVKRSLLGLLGLGVAVGLATITRSASAYFVPGVIIGGIVGLLTLLTVIVRQPTSAMFAAALERKPAEYYQQPAIMRAHMLITTAWAVVYLGRAGLRAYLIAIDQPELLGASAIVLGYPLTLALAAGTVLYVRRLAASNPMPASLEEEPA